MDYSTFLVPAYDSAALKSEILLVAFFVTALVFIGAGFFRRPSRFRIILISISGSVAAVTFFAMVMALPAVFELEDQQDAQFAQALEDTYGATSSVPYSKMVSSDNYEADLISEGTSTLVRFIDRDGKLVPVILSSAEYPVATQRTGTKGN